MNMFRKNQFYLIKYAFVTLRTHTQCYVEMLNDIVLLDSKKQIKQCAQFEKALVPTIGFCRGYAWCRFKNSDPKLFPSIERRFISRGRSS